MEKELSFYIIKCKLISGRAFSVRREARSKQQLVEVIANADWIVDGLNSRVLNAKQVESFKVVKAWWLKRTKK